MNIPIYSDLMIYGGATINGEVLINNTAKANYYQAEFGIWNKGYLTVDSNTTLNAKLDVSGYTTLKNKLTVNDFTNLKAGLGVAGDAHIYSMLQVDKGTVLLDTLHVRKDISTYGALKIWSASGLTIADANQSSKGVIKPNSNNLLIQAVNSLQFCSNNNTSNIWSLSNLELSLNNTWDVPIIGNGTLVKAVAIDGSKKDSPGYFGEELKINQIKIYRLYRSTGSYFKVRMNAITGTYTWFLLTVTTDAKNQRSYSDTGGYTTFNSKAADEYFYNSSIDDKGINCIIILKRES